MLLFSLYNKKRLAVWHMIRPILPMTLLIPSYDIGKHVGLKTYQHPHVLGPLKLSKMKLIHIAGVLQTAPHDGVYGTFEMSSVTRMNINIGQVFLMFENCFSI